jgi:hypothetical protein
VTDPSSATGQSDDPTEPHDSASGSPRWQRTVALLGLVLLLMLVVQFVVNGSGPGGHGPGRHGGEVPAQTRGTVEQLAAGAAGPVVHSPPRAGG